MRDVNSILDELVDATSSLQLLSLGEQVLIFGSFGLICAGLLLAFCWDGDSQNKPNEKLHEKTNDDLLTDSSLVGQSLYEIDPNTSQKPKQKADSTVPESTRLPIPSPSSATKIMRTPNLVTAGRNIYLVGVMFVVTWAMFSVILAASKRWLRK